MTTSRTYHDVEGSVYILPADKAETERLSLQHRVLTRAFSDRLWTASLSIQQLEGADVLDNATGSGAWLFDLAKRCKDAGVTAGHLIGTDMTDKQFPQLQDAGARSDGAPSLQIANALALPKEWTNRFTLAHQRLLTFALTASEWPRCLSELHRVIKPGGYVELSETAHTLFKYPPGTPGDQFVQQHLFRLMDHLSLSKVLPTTMEGMLIEAGFVDVRIVEVNIPLNENRGAEAKEASRNFHDAFCAFSEAVVKAGLAPADETGHRAHIDAVRDQWNREDVHHKFVAWSARKP